MATRPFVTLPVIWSLCLPLFARPAGAVETVAPHALETATSEGVASKEQEELQLLFEEKDLVTATKRSTPLRKAPAIATIITAHEIRNMGARTLVDVLRMVPGFGISFNEQGINQIEVRGIRTANGEKILLMIDGHPMNKNPFGSALYLLADALPIENIKQVEVVRGPGSALFGNSAFLATINIITRDADEIDGVEMKLGGGSFDTFKGNLVAGTTHTDQLSASGSFDYYRTSGPKLLVQSDVLRNTPYSQAPGFPDLSVRQIDAFLKVLYGDFSFRGQYLATRKWRYIGIGFALTDDDYNDAEYYWGELVWSRRIAAGLTTTLKLHYDHYRQDPNLKIRPNGFNGSFPSGQISRPLAKDRTTGAELELDWDLFEGNHLIAGVAYDYLRQYDVKHLANFDPVTGVDLGPIREVANFNRNADRHIWALYLQDEWQPLERVNLTAGVRYDHYSDFGDTVNPRAGLVWNIIDPLDLKLLYGRAFRAPSFAELYARNSPVLLGNPSLEPETITTFEAGIIWRPVRFVDVNLGYFHSAIDDQIVRDSTTMPAHYANAGKSTTQGVEIGLSGIALRTLQWKATYSYQVPRNALTDQRLPFVPSHRATASLNYAFVPHLNLHSDLIWTGPRPRAQGETRPAMPAYATVDVAVTARELFKTLELQLAVHNLFDEHFKDPDTSGPANNIPGDFPREGISVMANALFRL